MGNIQEFAIPYTALAFLIMQVRLLKFLKLVLKDLLIVQFNMDSDLGKELEAGKMALPIAEPLDGFPDFTMPYYFVGDEAFALKSWMQRPFPGKNLIEEKRIFNYRLSRARRTIENAFGIMVARWRILAQPISSSVDTAQKIVQATVCLHNYLRQTNCATYCPQGFVDSEDTTGDVKPGEWRREVDGGGTLGPLVPCRGSRHPQYAAKAREVLKQYLNSEHGSVEWQWAYVRNKGPTL
ncbi:hypothetical protein QZH41_015570 [Actinostola sp. cb2023]|nr:hypothetical protein QZH41_015570 [Actinostola sp. cb2023]